MNQKKGRRESSGKRDGNWKTGETRKRARFTAARSRGGVTHACPHWLAANGEQGAKNRRGKTGHVPLARSSVAAFPSPLSPHREARVFFLSLNAGSAREERARARQQAAPCCFFFFFFHLPTTSTAHFFPPLPFLSLSLFLPRFPTNATAAEAGKPLKMHHEKLAKKGGADEAGEGTK